MNLRPQLYRRVGRELLRPVPWQEILILMLVYQCIRIWLSTLVVLNSIFTFYQKRLTGVHPSGIAFNNFAELKLFSLAGVSKCCCDSLKIPFVVIYILTGLAPLNSWFDVTDIQNLHPLVLLLLVPKFMKVCVCSVLSFLPLLALYKLKERTPLPQFMLWMRPVRRHRSELGASGYYLERPFSEVVINPTDYHVKRSNSCGDVNNMKLMKPRKLRTRKSVSV